MSSFVPHPALIALDTYNPYIIDMFLVQQNLCHGMFKR